MAAKGAIKRVYNKLACFVEREQARPQVNIRKFFAFIILIVFICYFWFCLMTRSTSVIPQVS